MFPRRTVQRALDAIAPRLTAGDAKHLLNELRNPCKRLPAEWEVVSVAAMSHLAHVTHQGRTGGGRRPDMHVVAHERGLEFIVDVRTVSDSSAVQLNPYDYFSDKVHEAARRLGMSGTGLYIEVQPATRTDGGRRVLALPPKGEIITFIKKHLRPFLARIAKSRTSDELNIEIDIADIRVRLCFDPTAQFAGGHHLVYTLPRAAIKNPLYNALDKKADQLRETQSSVLKGVVVCDGGCDSLNRTPDAIVREFFERHSSTLTFIVIVSVARVPISFMNSKLRAIPRIYWNPRHPDNGRAAIESLFADWASSMPHLTRDPNSAFRYPVSEDCHQGESFYGAVRIDEIETMRFSARALLRLISGELPQEQFVTDHPLIVGSLRYRLEHGQDVKFAGLEHCDDEDDDWALFSSVTTGSSFRTAADGTADLSCDSRLLQRLASGQLAYQDFVRTETKSVNGIRAQLAQRRRLADIGTDTQGEDAKIWFEFAGIDAALSPFELPSPMGDVK